MYNIVIDKMISLQVQINCSFHSQLHNGAVPEADTVLKSDL